jgi:lysylphosphatidylglycerol synthetase-like protein (DUF2156 family)
VLALASRLPFTIGYGLVLIVMGVVTGAFWTDLEHTRWWSRLAFGLPALEDGRWWTPVTGSLVADGPVGYIPILGIFVLVAGLAEWRLGTAKTALITICGQLFGVLATAGLLWSLEDSEWAWATTRSHELDVGTSAGLLTMLVVYAFTLRPPWRSRLIVVVFGFCVISLGWVGQLYDIEHMMSALLGLAVGWLIFRPSPSSWTFSRHEARLTTAALFVFVSAAQLTAMFFPDDGPLGASHTSSLRPIIIVFVILQLLVAGGLVRGNRLAWYVALVLAGLGLLASLSLHPAPRLLAGLVIYIPVVFLLVRDRRAYRAPIAALGRRQLIRDIIGILVAYAAYVFIGFAAIDSFRPEPTAGQELKEFADRVVLSTSGEFVGATRGARVFLDSLSWLVPLAAISLLLAVLLRTRRPSSSVDRGRIVELIKEHGGGNISWMATWPGNFYFVTADGQAALAYQVHSNVALVLGDPIGSAPAVPNALNEFAEHCESQGWLPCLFSTGAVSLEPATALGWRHAQIAEDTIIDLPPLEFKGKSWQDVRSAINRAAKTEVTFRMVRLADEPYRVVSQVRGICEDWIGSKGLPEMGFTLGGVDEALDHEVYVGLAEDADGTIEGVTSWLPVHGEEGEVTGWTLDVMRRRTDGFRPVMEFMIASACLTFKDQGALTVSLSGAPLARSDPDERLAGIDNVLDLIGRLLEPFYGFRTLHQFKAKFQPRTEPMYLCYTDEAALPRIGIALTQAYLPDAKLRDFAGLLVGAH